LLLRWVTKKVVSVFVRFSCAASHSASKAKNKRVPVVPERQLVPSMYLSCAEVGTGGEGHELVSLPSVNRTTLALTSATEHLYWAVGLGTFRGRTARFISPGARSNTLRTARELCC
jgi:hypothetical protein